MKGLNIYDDGFPGNAVGTRFDARRLFLALRASTAVSSASEAWL